MKNLALTLLFILFQFTGYSQSKGEKKLGTWNELTVSNKISGKININGSFTNWNYNLNTNQELLLGILSLNYNLNKNVVIGMGYAKGEFEPDYNDNQVINIKENRILEQISIKHNKSSNIVWSHRFRLEHRFLEYPIEEKLKHRLRYRFKGNLPINNTFFITIYDEIHFVLNAFDFHQNRAYVALGTKFNNSMNLELGYVRHSYKAKSFNRLSLQLNLKFDFRKED